MNKIKKYLLNLWYGLPFGLKAADTEIMGSNNNGSDGSSIHQEVSDERVAKHLLKGEVTQEVEELRYRTYKVEEESKGYKYIGNGIAIKQEKEEKKEKTRFKFSQDRNIICEGVLDGLKQVGSYGVDRYMFEIGYSEFVRFKLEKYITKIDVDIDETIGKIETTLHFSSEPNPYDAPSMAFINELKKLMNNTDEYSISKHEFATKVKDLSFSTYKAYNEDDFVSYSFVNDSEFKGCKEDKYDILLTLSWNEYIRVPLNLESKYYSKSMAEKYARKEKKNVSPNMGNIERKRYCSVCGKEMSVYDADILEYDGHKVICKECMEKALKNE